MNCASTLDPVGRIATSKGSRRATFLLSDSIEWITVTSSYSIDSLSPIRCHRFVVTDSLSPIRCHRFVVTDSLSPIRCHQELSNGFSSSAAIATQEHDRGDAGSRRVEPHTEEDASPSSAARATGRNAVVTGSRGAPPRRRNTRGGRRRLAPLDASGGTVIELSLAARCGRATGTRESARRRASSTAPANAGEQRADRDQELECPGPR